MDDLLLLAAPVSIIGLNVLLWRLSYGFNRVAGSALFVLSLVLGSPLIGLGVWYLANLDAEPSAAGSYGDVLVTVAAVALNGLIALVAAVAAALRKPAPRADAAEHPEAESRRVRLRSD
ncbi:putative membrane protein [Lysobacter antibioticus]|uniref:Transmembrane protein n=1 Tax=Lysobacter antibioticus TaxID=84531 RepID=A0A0S2FCW0_LYSAN|nr:hypothetical protein [Lysobacter antibioticus]ALN65649.1 putative membrane protein [Lysobacter antibioticus]ALN81410.1 hypothetical protein LA76x_3283 [Lysobacter antibioticus]